MISQRSKSIRMGVGGVIPKPGNSEGLSISTLKSDMLTIPENIHSQIRKNIDQSWELGKSLNQACILGEKSF